MNDSVKESLAQRSKIADICAVFKAYTEERACKATEDRLRGSYYLSRDDHDWKIRTRKQKTGIGKYSFVTRTIILWKELSTEALENFCCRSHIFKRRVRKVIVSEV
jgi:hypothetical protein